jgi:hypothetical protein
LLLYPNPATDTIYILAASTQNAVYEVEIQDAIGRRIKIIQGVQAGKVVPHSVQDYPYGTYQVELRYNGGTVTGRFVVK